MISRLIWYELRNLKCSTTTDELVYFTECATLPVDDHSQLRVTSHLLSTMLACPTLLYGQHRSLISSSSMDITSPPPPKILSSASHLRGLLFGTCPFGLLKQLVSAIRKHLIFASEPGKADLIVVYLVTAASIFIICGVQESCWNKCSHNDLSSATLQFLSWVRGRLVHLSGSPKNPSRAVDKDGRGIQIWGSLRALPVLKHCTLNS